GIWVPPPGRADSGNQSVGYDVYNRFDLGSPGNPTLYGTEAGLKALASAVHQFDGKLYLDLVWNHDGFRDQTSVDGQGHSFANAGGYPGFVLRTPTDPNGDFHDRNATSTWVTRVAGLIDIAQDKNYQYVRNPVPGYTNTLPARTTPPSRPPPQPARQQHHPLPSGHVAATDHRLRPQDRRAEPPHLPVQQRQPAERHSGRGERTGLPDAQRPVVGAVRRRRRLPRRCRQEH